MNQTDNSVQRFVAPKKPKIDENIQILIKGWSLDKKKHLKEKYFKIINENGIKSSTCLVLVTTGDDRHINCGKKYQSPSCFSSINKIYTLDRTSLKDETVEAMMFCKKNWGYLNNK